MPKINEANASGNQNLFNIKIVDQIKNEQSLSISQNSDYSNEDSIQNNAILFTASEKINWPGMAIWILPAAAIASRLLISLVTDKGGKSNSDFHAELKAELDRKTAAACRLLIKNNSDTTDRNINEARDIAMELQNGGRIFLAEGNAQFALTLYSRARWIFEKSGDPVHAGIAKMNIGRILRKMGKVEDSAKHLRDAYEILTQNTYGINEPEIMRDAQSDLLILAADQSENPFSQALARIIAAQKYVGETDWQQAIEMLNTAEIIGNRNHIPDLEVLAIRYKVRVYKAMDVTHAAKAANEKANEISRLYAVPEIVDYKQLENMFGIDPVKGAPANPPLFETDSLKNIFYESGILHAKGLRLLRDSDSTDSPFQQMISAALDAVEYFDKAINGYRMSGFPTYEANVRVAKAGAFVEIGNWNSALAELNEAINLYKESSGNEKNIAEALVLKGSSLRELAIENADRKRELILQMRSAFDEALNIYSRPANASGPEFTHTLLEYGLSLDQLGESSRAIITFSRLAEAAYLNGDFESVYIALKHESSAIDNARAQLLETARTHIESGEAERANIILDGVRELREAQAVANSEAGKYFEFVKPHRIKIIKVKTGQPGEFVVDVSKKAAQPTGTSRMPLETLTGRPLLIGEVEMDRLISSACEKTGMTRGDVIKIFTGMNGTKVVELLKAIDLPPHRAIIIGRSARQIFGRDITKEIRAGK